MFKITSGSLRRSPRPPSRYRGFLPSAIAASPLRRLQFPKLTCLGLPCICEKLKFSPVHSPIPRPLYSLDFFTSNLSHHLKFLKICPGVTEAKLKWLLTNVPSKLCACARIHRS